MIDTANIYSAGLSEEIVGEVLAGRSDDLMVTTKARMPVGEGPNDQGASRAHLIRECERSLKRLRRDHIDLYYVHQWDGTTPVEETMAALDTLVRDGKVRYVGCSNYAGWHVMKSLAAADRAGHASFVAQQIHYTLEAREAEYELLPLSVDQGLGVQVWSPLAGGLLSGKHTRGAWADGSRQASGWDEPPIRDASVAAPQPESPTGPPIVDAATACRPACWCSSSCWCCRRRRGLRRKHGESRPWRC